MQTCAGVEEDATRTAKQTGMQICTITTLAFNEIHGDMNVQLSAKKWACTDVHTDIKQQTN